MTPEEIVADVLGSAQLEGYVFDDEFVELLLWVAQGGCADEAVEKIVALAVPGRCAGDWLHVAV